MVGYGTAKDSAVSVLEEVQVFSHMKLMVGAVFGLLSTSWAFPQQLGVVNLPLPESTQPVAQEKVARLPPGCTQPTGVMANGAVKPPDNQRRTISLEIVKLSNRTLEVGGESRAEVRLKNVGDTPIDIPWSTDSGVMKEAPNPDVLQWEQANLGIVLLDKKNKTIALKTADWPLYGSRFVGGSQLTIKPGEWVTAFIEFKVEDLYHIVSFTEFPVGEARLSVEWEQASRAWGREKCGWSRAWFDYGGDYYKQERPTIAVQINRSGPGAGENTK
jgi:hypothetical protein